MLNISLITTYTCVTNPPLDSPWKLLATINIFILLLSAAKIELPKNIAELMRIIGFRPQISENFVQMGPEAAFAMI